MFPTTAQLQMPCQQWLHIIPHLLKVLCQHVIWLPKFVLQDPKSSTWIVEAQSICTLCHLLVTSKGIATSHPNSTLFPKPSSLKSFKCLIIKVKVKWQLGKVGLDEWCRWLYKDHQSLFQQHLGWNCRMDHLNITFEVARGTFWLWNCNSFMCLGTKVDNISLLQVNTLRPLM
jgi:hypothetical protein